MYLKRETKYRFIGSQNGGNTKWLKRHQTKPKKKKRSKPTKASQTSFTKSTYGPQQRWKLGMILAFWKQLQDQNHNEKFYKKEHCFHDQSTYYEFEKILQDASQGYEL